jgi:hypothetical protein
MKNNIVSAFVFFAVITSCSEKDIEPTPTVNDIYPLTGVAGMNVTVKGKGFKTTTEVKFNGIAGINVSSSDTVLIVKVPNSTTGAITIANGSKSLNSYSFRYLNIYVLGNEDVNSKSNIKIWRNGKIEQITDTNETAFGNSIFVSGQDIYIAGYTFTTTTYPTYWKNKEAHTLSSTGPGLCLDIFVEGNDVYACGILYNGSSYVAGYWKNGNWHPLTDGAQNDEVNSIIKVGADLYLVGSYKKVATYWKNDVATPLPINNSVTVGYDIQVSQGDVYVLGQNFPEGTVDGYVTVWKNGIPRSLSGSSNNAFAYSMTVEGTNVFVGGFETNSQGKNVATVWINSQKYALTDGEVGADVRGMSVIEDTIILTGSFYMSGKTLPFFLVNDYVEFLTSGDNIITVNDVDAF